jgi:hypothetical protein
MRLNIVPQIVHTIEAIEALLRRGITPKTDNLDALLELGFARSTPRAEDGYDATLFERGREHDRRASDGSRLFIRERAVFERPPTSEPAHDEAELVDLVEVDGAI